MIIAGEASGDLHGASLMREMKALDPGLKFFGIGGDRMIAEGLSPAYHIRQMAFLGFVEVLKHIPFIRKVQRNLLAEIEEKNINSVILIDYPGFNLSIAKKLKAAGKKVIYYISPQVWAWGKGRIRKIRELVDKMIVVFPFEKDLYDNNNISAEYVGHPLIEQIENYGFLTRDELNAKFNLDAGKDILLVLPGSRKQEIKKIFPETIKAAIKLAKEFNLQTVVACSENLHEEGLFNVTGERDFRVIKGHTYDLLKHSKFGIIKSGTSTLEAAIFGLPFIVVYSTSRLTYMIGKSLVNINNIAMANIVAGETVVDELIQDDLSEKNIYEKSKSVLSSAEKYSSLKEKLKKVKSKLGGKGASGNAAKIALSVINEAE